MGINSMNQIIKILQNDNKVDAADIHSLKELVLNNVQIKQIKDLREFTDGLANLYNQRLAKLSIQNMNLNDSKIVNDLCAFLDENDKLRSLTLS